MNENSTMQPMTASVAKVLATLTILNGGILIISNLLASKIWGFKLFGIQFSFDAGLIVFPLVYGIGDLIIEIYGKRMADWVAYVSCLLNLLAFGCYALADYLPTYPGQAEISFTMVLGLSRSIIVASVIGYLTSQLINNQVFEWIRKRSSEHSFVLRAFGSSLPARLADTILFNTIAFGGRLPAGELLRHGCYAFLIGSTLEWLLCPLTRRLAYELCNRIEYRHGARCLATIDFVLARTLKSKSKREIA